MSWKTTIILAAALITGCGYVDQAKQKVGLGPTPQQIEAQKKEQAEREKAEREQAFQALQEADKLTDRWAAKLKDGPEHEGITERDPWGNMIATSYIQEGFNRRVLVTSNGPDGQPGGGDDIVHSRTTSYPYGALNGFGYWPLGLGIWFICGIVALGGTSLKGKHKVKKHQFISSLAIVLVSPFALLACMALFLGKVLIGMIGVIGGGDGPDFDGFDIGFDFFDFDIDF